MKNHWPSPANTESTLLHSLVGFGRRLRAAGVAVDPASMIDLFRATDHVDIGEREDLKAAARATQVRSREELVIFEQIFDDYWGCPQQYEPVPRPARGNHEHGDLPPPRSALEPLARQMLLDGCEEGADSLQPNDDETISYSEHDVLRHNDLGTLDETEIAEARRLIAELVKTLSNRPGRRYQPARRSNVVDFRRSFRQNLGHGFAAIKLAYRKRRKKKLKLVVLCDVSGSMARYSSFLLDFIFALRAELPSTQAAVFTTHMTPITDPLRTPNITRSLQSVSAAIGGWGGGTDIGGSLAEFNDYYARSMLRSKSIVVILSDGWDRGNAPRMRMEIARLRRRAYKLIWLNPLLGNADYQPLCRGVRTALPYIDYFLPAHNLASLAAVTDRLRRL